MESNKTLINELTGAKPAHSVLKPLTLLAEARAPSCVLLKQMKEQNPSVSMKSYPGRQTITLTVKMLFRLTPQQRFHRGNSDAIRKKSNDRTKEGKGGNSLRQVTLAKVLKIFSH